MIVKVMGISKKGRQQIRRHGDIWAIVARGKAVPCLGGATGMKLQSLLDKAEYWVRLEGDTNLEILGRP